MTKTKWLLYTVLIGLIPFIVRFLIFLSRDSMSYLYILNEVDLAAFGLVLCVSNITECDGNVSLEPRARTFNIGFSTFLIIIFAVFLGFSYLSDLPGATGFNKISIKWTSLAISFIAFYFSYTIFKRLD